MKKAIYGLTLLLMTATAQADLSGNLGYASEYHFRGILQKNSSASGGLDYESGGFYVGTWAADVGDGLEVDGYFGYGTEVGDFGLSVGYTGYFYTGDTFDDTYQEINLGASFGILSLDVAVGKHDLDEDIHGATGDEDYTFVSLTLEDDSGLYGTLGSFSQDFDGEYLELGYGTTVAEIDLGIALIFANDDLVGDAEESIVFSIGKSFDL